MKIGAKGQAPTGPGAVTLVAFHPGARPGSSEKARRPEESALAATEYVSVVITYKAFSTFTLQHFGKDGSEGTIINSGNEVESISLEPNVLVETVESIVEDRAPTLALVLEDGKYIWIGLASEFIFAPLANGINTVVGKKPGTGLKLLTTRHPVKLI